MDGHGDAAGLACPAKAKALLAEAGFPNGFKARAEVLNTSQQYLTACQQIAADLAKIGVQMEMVSMTIPDLVGKLTKSRAWEGTAFDFETLPAADALRLKTWHSCFNRSRPLTRAGLLPAALDGARASR